MRITVEKLRMWIVLLGVLLVLALITFFAYARYRVRQIGHDLPQKLGLEIQQSTNNFTISKSSKGRTLFVLHASKAVQYKGGGRAALHDVSIELYSPDGSRTDRISGSEFDYDPATKIVRADGLVDILLSDPRAQLPKGAGSGDSEESKKSIHVKTRGLVFNQETQLATTEDTLTFEQDGSSGSARGATYDGSKGTLSLAHDVLLQTLLNGESVHVKAESAGFDRNSRQMFLIQQTVNYQQKHGTSDQATVFFRPDGKTDHIQAQGHVRLRAEDGSDLQASVGTAQLDANGTLQQVKLDGGLLFVSHGPFHSLHVNSNGGVFSFVPASKGVATSTAGRLNQVRLAGAVSAVDQETGLSSDPRGSETRDIRAGQLVIEMKAGSTGSVQPESVLASGNAEVTIHTIHANAPQEVTKLKGEQLFSTLLGGNALSTLRATGNASLEQSTPGGLSQMTRADLLSVKFVPDSAALPDAKKATTHRADKKAADPISAGNRIDTASLSGHAVLVQQQDAIAGGEKTVATADHMSYAGSTGVMLLSGGNPRVTKGESDMTASSIEFNHNTGDANATGGVKASYVNSTPAKQDSGSEPGRVVATNDVTHVVATRALLDHAKDETTFFGSAHADARIWQGTNSISAPKIKLSRAQQSLLAEGGVKATFVESSKAKSAAAPATQSRFVQTSSSSLSYSAGERKITVAGGVMAHDAEGTISAAMIELYLEQGNIVGASTPGGPPAGSAGPGGQVSRMIAEKNVRLTQGDRSGTGERLTYTADDGRFVLTGTTAAPPFITDREHGTVSGSSLIFNDRDDSVVVSRGQSPTMTDSHTKSDSHGKSVSVRNHPTGTVQ